MKNVHSLIAITTSILLASCLPQSKVTVTGGPSGYGGTPGVGPGGTTVQPSAAKVVPQVMGVEQYLAQMKKIFYVPNGENIAFASISAKWRDFWGGGCDYYGTVTNGNTWSNMDDQTQVCGMSGTGTGPVGGFSVIKEGARINACEYFNNSEATLDAFFNKGIVTGQEFNKANAKAAFEMFYPQYDFTDAIYDNFIQSTNAAYPAITSDNRLRWRVFLSTLCQSLYWEIL